MDKSPLWKPLFVGECLYANDLRYRDHLTSSIGVILHILTTVAVQRSGAVSTLWNGNVAANHVRLDQRSSAARAGCRRNAHERSGVTTGQRLGLDEAGASTVTDGRWEGSGGTTTTAATHGERSEDCRQDDKNNDHADDVPVICIQSGTRKTERSG